MMPSAPAVNPREIVAQYFAWGFRVVLWPRIGDTKGPSEKNWPAKVTTLDDYHEGNRVGVLLGAEIAPGQFLHDVDIDWGPGAPIALALLPPTAFVFGRAGKHTSHGFYTLAEALVSCKYADPVDNICLIELRGTKVNGELGLQTMVPPSVWSKDGVTELLEFRSFGPPTFNTEPKLLSRRPLLAAIGMLLAKRLGHNGFGHDARLCWAGCLLRAGVTADELTLMGEAMSLVCNNREVGDVRRVVDSTAASLTRGDKKVKGGPALAQLLGPQGKKVVAAIGEWLGRGQTDFLRNKKGDIIHDSQDNIRLALERLGVTLSYNEFTRRMLIQEEEGGPLRPLEDGPCDDLWLRIDAEMHFKPTDRYFEKCIGKLAREHTFHPVRDYLDSLTWDDVPRIHTWLVVYGGAVDPSELGDADDSLTYLEAVSSILLKAAVKRIFEPGCKFDEMVVLESPQGVGKSTALQALCPDVAWFSDDLPLNVTSKELIERTLGKWIIEASDLAGRRKTEIEQLKAMLSRQTDGARMAYARRSDDRPRHFVIVGTTNGQQYLPDPTGARRFWPVATGTFDIDALQRDRDQLWAEAVARVRRGESIRLPEGLWPAAAKEQEKRYEDDPWEPIVRDFLESQAFLDSQQMHLTRRQVTSHALYMTVGLADVSRRDPRAGRRLSDIMQRLGFTRRKVWDKTEQRTVNGYVEGDDE